MKTSHFKNESVVVSLEYFDEGKCFVAGFQNGLTCVFDENDMEDCHLVRSFEKYNRHEELLTAKFDPRSRTVATAGGSANVARLWSYDSGKCDTELFLGTGSTVICVDLIILHPYPIIVTSDTTGNIIIWGSRGSRWQGLRISGFLNCTPAYAEYEKRQRRADEEEDIAPIRALPPVLHHFSKQSTRKLNRLDSERTNIGGPGPQTRQRGLRNSFNPLSEALRVDPILKANSEAAFKQLYDETESKWGKVSAASTICWDSENFRLFTGDEIGNIRCFDLFDIFQDLRADTLLEDTSKHRILGLCRGKQRNYHSALPPMFDENVSDEFDAASAHYLLGHPGNAMSYLGVQFVWSFLGHNDRIMHCSLVPSMGLLTSAADRLVKMWTLDGKPLGVLLQSVPVGTKARSWEFDIDVERIIKAENENLDNVIERAVKVAKSPSKPDLNTLDFAGMEVGAESADFSKSELRQRIEKSSKILGLDFPRNESSKHHQLIPLPPTTIAMNFNNDNNSSIGGGGLRKEDSITLGENNSIASSQASKSLIDALKELKSTESAVDYDLKTKQMTLIQQKRKAQKLLSISKESEEKTEKKTGVKVKLHTDKVHHNHSHLRSGNYPHALGEEEEEKSQAELDKLLTATSHFATIAKHHPTASSSSVLSPREPSVMEEQLSLEMTSSSLSLEIGNKPDHVFKQRDNRFSSVKSKIMDSIKDVQSRGARTISMVNSCRKYSAFNALDQAISSGKNGTTEIKPDLTPEEIAEVRANRERKHKELLASLILNDTKPSSSISKEHSAGNRASAHARSKSILVNNSASSDRPRRNSAATQSSNKTSAKNSIMEGESIEITKGDGDSERDVHSVHSKAGNRTPLRQNSAAFSLESLGSND
jgi:hypothetical protein